MSSCGINLSHSPRGKVADTPLRAPMVCAFPVCSAHSARFRLCWPFVTISYSTLFSFMVCLNSVEHSLSNTCFLGLIPDDLSRCIKIRSVRKILPGDLFRIASLNMTLLSISHRIMMYLFPFLEVIGNALV